jgi:hypothetical protein
VGDLRRKLTGDDPSIELDGDLLAMIELSCMRTRSAAKTYGAVLPKIRELEQKEAEDRIGRCVYAVKTSASAGTSIDIEARCRQDPGTMEQLAEEVTEERRRLVEKATEERHRLVEEKLPPLSEKVVEACKAFRECMNRPGPASCWYEGGPGERYEAACNEFKALTGQAPHICSNKSLDACSL